MTTITIENASGGDTYMNRISNAEHAIRDLRFEQMRLLERISVLELASNPTDLYEDQASVTEVALNSANKPSLVH